MTGGGNIQTDNHSQCSEIYIEVLSKLGGILMERPWKSVIFMHIFLNGTQVAMIAIN